MREIEFRAWHCNADGRNNGTMLFVGDNYGTKHALDCCRYAIDGQPVTLMQYTGLKDKNGTKIFEGDIVKLKTINCEKGGWYSSDKAQGVVEFNDVWGVRFVCKDFSQRTAEHNWITKSRKSKEVNNIVVIGNIYENPELIK